MPYQKLLLREKVVFQVLAKNQNMHNYQAKQDKSTDGMHITHIKRAKIKHHHNDRNHLQNSNQKQ